MSQNNVRSQEATSFVPQDIDLFALLLSLPRDKFCRNDTAKPEACIDSQLRSQSHLIETSNDKLPNKKGYRTYL